MEGKKKDIFRSDDNFGNTYYGSIDDQNKYVW